MGSVNYLLSFGSLYGLLLMRFFCFLFLEIGEQCVIYNLIPLFCSYCGGLLSFNYFGLFLFLFNEISICCW